MSIKIFHKQPIPTHGIVREFSEELHGKDYKNIAKNYCERYTSNIDHVEGMDGTPAPIEKEKLSSGEVNGDTPEKPKAKLKKKK